MNKKILPIFLATVFLLAGCGNEMSPQAINSPQENIVGKEIKSIEDLIDGDYQNFVDTSGWQDYENRKIRFRVKMPQGWSAREDNGGVCFSQDIGGECDVFISKSENPQEKDWLRKTILNRKEKYGSSVLKIEIDDSFGVVVNNFGLETYFFNDSKPWIISSSAPLNSDSQIENIYPGFVGTFEFADQNEAEELISGEYNLEKTNVGNWKVYENKQMGFRMKIPNGWECSQNSGNKLLVHCLDKEAEENYQKSKKETGNYDITYDSLSIYFEEGGTYEDVIDKLSQENRVGKTFHSMELGQKRAVLVQQSKSVRVYSYNENKEWRIDFSAISDDYKTVFDGIIESFEFLD